MISSLYAFRASEDNVMWLFLGSETTPSRHEDEDREDQSFLEGVQQVGRLRCKAGSHFFVGLGFLVT